MVGAVGLASAKPDSTHDSRLQKSAQEFEAMLLADLLKMAKQDDQRDSELDQSCQGYDDLRNQAVATALARNGGIGIARMLVAHLEGKGPLLKSSHESPIAQLQGYPNGS